MDRTGGSLRSTDAVTLQQATNDSCPHFRLRLPPERWPLPEPLLSGSPSHSPTSHKDCNCDCNSAPVLGADCQTRPHARRAASLAPCDIRSAGGGLAIHTPPRFNSANRADSNLTLPSPGARQGQMSLSQSSSTQSSPGTSYPRLTRQRYHSRICLPSGRNARSILRRRRDTVPQFSLWNLSSPRTTAQTTARPIIQRVSAFTLYNKGSKRRTLDAIDYEIASMLKKGPGQPARSRRTNAAKNGVVYVLVRQETKGFVKIGKTDGEVSARMARISKKGYYGQFISHSDERDRPFKHFGFAEKIIQVELHNIRYESKFKAISQRTCVPGSHRREEGRTEWYKMDPQQAIEVVVRWRDWLHLCEPYDGHGNLRGYWEHVISNAEKYEKAKHGDIGSRWAALLKPPSHYQLGWYYLVCFFRISLKSLVYTLELVSTLCQRLYHQCYG